MGKREHGQTPTELTPNGLWCEPEAFCGQEVLLEHRGRSNEPYFKLYLRRMAGSIAAAGWVTSAGCCCCMA